MAEADVGNGKRINCGFAILEKEGMSGFSMRLWLGWVVCFASLG